MKKVCSIAFIAGILILYSALSWAQSIKIGYFDLQTILDESKWGKQAKEEFQSKQKALRGQVDKKANSFKGMMEEFEKKRAIMDEEARTKKLKELQEAKREGEKALMDSGAELNKLSSELSAPIIEKVLEIVRNIGKKENYTYILEVQKGGIVYAQDQDDLTKRILKELDKVGPKK